MKILVEKKLFNYGLVLEKKNKRIDLFFFLIKRMARFT